MSLHPPCRAFQSRLLQHLNPAAEAPQYMVGVVKDGKVTLHDAQLFRMEPSIKAAEAIATVELSLTDRDKVNTPHTTPKENQHFFHF